MLILTLVARIVPLDKDNFSFIFPITKPSISLPIGLPRLSLRFDGHCNEVVQLELRFLNSAGFKDR